MFGSDLLDANPDFFQIMQSPFNGERVVAVRSLVPDWAIVHVQEADEFGNARIIGSAFQDPLLSRAAKKTIVTTEKIVGTDRFRSDPDSCSIPHFLVEAVIPAPGGARPGICHGEYETVDAGGMKAYTNAIRAGTLNEYLAGTRKGGRS